MSKASNLAGFVTSISPPSDLSVSILTATSAVIGTAKPQEDDIIRSKTVAKVTSTHVTCTYEDGSYCVPCVLISC